MSVDALAELQGWLQSAIRAAAPPPDARRRIRAGSVSAEQRLAIYARGYWLRLLECMRAEFPALRSALGDELFDAFARGYLKERPSRSYSLTALGADFAHYLEASRPDRDAPLAARDASFDVLVDLARLERTYVEVWRGPGREERAESSWSRAPLLQLEDQTLRLEVGVRLLELRFPLLESVERARSGGSARPLPAPARMQLVLTRPAYRVVCFEPAAWEYRLLAGLERSRPGAAALREAEALAAGDADATAPRVRATLALWVERGVLRIS